MTYGSYDLGRNERAGLEHALFVVQNSWQCAVLCCFEDWMNNVNVRRELQSAHNQHHCPKHDDGIADTIAYSTNLPHGLHVLLLAKTQRYPLENQIQMVHEGSALIAKRSEQQLHPWSATLLQKNGDSLRVAIRLSLSRAIQAHNQPPN